MTRRSVQLENESADVLARNGYDIEQHPDVPGSRNPDFRIEGRIFDNYSPQANRPIQKIADTLQGKIDKLQADRFVVNLTDWAGDVGRLRQHFATTPIPGLQEVFVIDGNGLITRLVLV